MPAAWVEPGDPGLERGGCDTGGDVDASQCPRVRARAYETVVERHSAAISRRGHRVSDAGVPHAIRIREERRSDPGTRPNCFPAGDDLVLELRVAKLRERPVRGGV